MMTAKPTLRFVLAGGSSANSKAISDPSWSAIEGRINQLGNLGGAMMLEIVEGVDFPFDGVDVEAERGRYHLTYTKHHSRTDSEVYELFSFPEREGCKMVAIGGNFWDPRSVGSDINIVMRAFREFYETGRIGLEKYGLAEV